MRLKVVQVQVALQSLDGLIRKLYLETMTLRAFLVSSQELLPVHLPVLFACEFEQDSSMTCYFLDT